MRQVVALRHLGRGSWLGASHREAPHLSGQKGGNITKFCEAKTFCKESVNKLQGASRSGNRCARVVALRHLDEAFG